LRAIWRGFAVKPASLRGFLLYTIEIEDFMTPTKDRLVRL